MNNAIVAGAIEDAIEVKMSVERFSRFLIEALTASITYKRGVAPDEVKILNSAEQIAAIVADYEKRLAEL
jgi:hypothetical protein